MEDSFDIPVSYKNESLAIPARLITQGYSYKIETLINGSVVWFEPDEERNFRAVLPPDSESVGPLPDGTLLQAVAEALAAALQ